MFTILMTKSKKSGDLGRNCTERVNFKIVACFERNFLSLLLSLQIFLKMECHTFTAAVREYHYYQRFWRRKEKEKLICLYEAGNLFDRFAIKTVNKRKWRNCGTFTERKFNSNKLFLSNDNNNNNIIITIVIIIIIST